MKIPSRNKKSATWRILASSQQLAQTEALFESIGDGLLVTDEKGNINRINQVALAILGYAEEEVLGQWFPEFVQAQYEDGKPIIPLERPITRAILTGASISDKIYYMTKSGDRVPVAVTVSPIIVKGKPVGAIEVLRDITREQEIDRMKSDFISIASHQLRTPLSAIKTYTNMLFDGFQGELKPGQMEFLEIILGSVERMNETINMLLNISRIESGSMKIEPQEIDVVRLVKAMHQEQVSVAEKKKLKMTTSFSHRSLIITTDPLLLTEVFSNLVSNSIKYTPPEGRIKLVVSGTDRGVVLSVHDNGYGIPEELQGNIFTKFFRAANVTSKEAGGNGLGLYLAKLLAEALGGRLWFESQEGKGSVFYLALPRNRRLKSRSFRYAK